MDEELEKKYQKCQTISDIHTHIPYFQETLKRFHKDNQTLMQHTEQNIERLKDFLSSTEQDLILELKKVPSLLYWRSK